MIPGVVPATVVPATVVPATLKVTGATVAGLTVVGLTLLIVAWLTLNQLLHARKLFMLAGQLIGSYLKDGSRGKFKIYL